ncbi:MAG TPA: 2-succinyl-5-enolpyruvyl-6-hydroxy-3-cyclohexene-1-carboxylic-acid synthase, partial [Acidimicrobiaceae bacterium]|nr:2-succinyl-5-enolpyruvyl-6-hydroxy-3-cyclohexene-1-carboxylic-acid synthase [Acidimicrobiaceae bacterium]
MSNDPVYDACAAFANELASQGVCHAVISPGSRSTPLTLTFATTPGIKTWVRLDERSAAFFALGLAKSSRSPVVLICTSGTAAANYLPAVSEANWSETPLIILRANRPPELRGWGAG